jgi:hypothetical protein
LKKNQSELERVIKFQGFTDGRSIIPSCIFAVTAALKSNDEAAAEEKEQKDGQSISVGYNGETGLDYGKRKLTIMCDSVLMNLMQTNREIALTCWAKIGCGAFSGMGDSSGMTCRNRRTTSA